MRSLARLFPRQLRERLPRSVVAAALVLLLASPLLSRGESGFSDGYMVGGESGAASTANLVGLLLALAAPWLAEGIISDLRRVGVGPLVLTRPISRPGYYLSRWMAGLTCLAGVALATAAILNMAWSVWIGGGPGLSLAGSVGAGLVIWVWIGSAVLLFSALLDRGEALVGALMVAIPLTLMVALPSTAPMAEAAAVLPTRPMLRSARVLLTGSSPAWPDLLTVSVWGFVTLLVGLAVASHRNWNTSD